MNCGVSSCGLSALTSATFPNSPSMLRWSSCLSGNSWWTRSNIDTSEEPEQHRSVSTGGFRLRGWFSLVTTQTHRDRLLYWSLLKVPLWELANTNTISEKDGFSLCAFWWFSANDTPQYSIDSVSNSSLTCRHFKNRLMPRQLRNIWQLSGVSSVMFHKALQENSITWSHWGRPTTPWHVWFLRVPFKNN